mmetsp:Transcript_120275/g.345809  ORF Transcript_120275/g.345809 Transcript_120275/m.345809 type:complete len:240 (+) Transcript_120275:561-1280(+)
MVSAPTWKSCASSIHLSTQRQISSSCRLSKSPSEPKISRSPADTANSYGCASLGESNFALPWRLAACTRAPLPSARSLGKSSARGSRVSWNGWLNECCCSSVRPTTLKCPPSCWEPSGVTSRRTGSSCLRKTRRPESPKFATPTMPLEASRQATSAVAAPNARTAAKPAASAAAARSAGEAWALGGSSQACSVDPPAAAISSSAKWRGFSPKRQPHSPTPSAMPAAVPVVDTKKASSPP